MTEPLDSVSRLARVAAQEAAPPCDVSQRVLDTVRGAQREKVYPLALFALGSLATAIAVVAYAFTALSALLDPLGSFYQMAAAIAP